MNEFSLISITILHAPLCIHNHTHIRQFVSYPLLIFLLFFLSSRFDSHTVKWFFLPLFCFSLGWWGYHDAVYSFYVWRIRNFWWGPLFIRELHYWAPLDPSGKLLLQQLGLGWHLGIFIFWVCSLPFILLGLLSLSMSLRFRPSPFYMVHTTWEGKQKWTNLNPYFWKLIHRFPSKIVSRF